MRDRTAYKAAWYLRNRERLLAKARNYRAEHLEEKRQADREYARTHSNQAVKRVLEWRKRNPQKAAEQRRRYRTRHSAARAAWWREKYYPRNAVRRATDRYRRIPDSVIRARLRMPGAPAELIAAKRELILAKRALKELSHETR